VCIVKKKVEKLRSVGNRTAKKQEKARVAKVKRLLQKSMRNGSFATKPQIEKYFYSINAVNLLGEYHERCDC
jgi:hypothetical protein